MKNKYSILLILLFLTIGVFAQTPEKINYQAVARDLSGTPLVSQAIAVVIEVRQGSASGADVYKEAHAVTTNAFGLFTLEIGGGTILGGAFNTISWGTSSYYLYIEVDGNPIGASQLLSVPYALYAKQALNGSGNSIELVDGDADTKVMVDSNNTDDDVIHFINAGVEYVTFKQGRIDIHNNGNSVFIGLNSGSNDDFSLNGNVGIGANSLKNNISGGANTAIGENTLIGNVTTSGNVAVGNGAISGSSFAGDRNIGIGEISMRNATTAFDNVGVGFATLQNMTTGYSNVAIGTGALENVVGGTSNIAIGYEALRFTLGSGNIAIGEKAGQNELGSNKLYIENSSSSSPLIYGDFANDSIHINGKLKINDGTQGNNKILTSDANGNASWQLPSAAGDNWGSQVVISSGSNISGNGTSGNPLIVIDSVNDADSDPNNERISTFALNTTSDSLVITEAGVRHSFPLSSLSDGDWTFGAGKIYNTTDLVGIGTSSPQEKLHIADGDPDLIIQDISGIGNAMRATIAFKDQVLGSVLDFGMKANGPTLTSHISGENLSFQNNFGTGVGTRLFISGINGNIGIGTTSPTSPLTINTKAGNEIEFVGGFNSDIIAPSQLNLFSGGLSLFDATDFNFFTASTLRMSILNNGNVGIGISAPTALLDIRSPTLGNIQMFSGTNASFPLLITPMGSGGKYLRFVHPSGQIVDFGSNGISGLIGTSSNDDVLFMTNGNPVVTLKTGGNVGVGTTNPAVTLDVSGNTNILSNSGDPLVVRSSVDGFALTVRESDNGFDAVKIFGYGTRGRLLMNDNGTTNINFDANSTLPSFINAGNFGVGTITPSAKLDVNGTFKLGATGNVNSKYLAGSVQTLITALTSSVSNNYRAINIPGAVVGDYVVITMAGGTAPQVVLTSASVVSANTVGLNLFNITGASAPGGTYTFNYIIYR